MLDVGSALSCIGNYTSIPGFGCWRHYTYDVHSYIPGAGCWLYFIYTRCLMLAILYLYQVETVHRYHMMEVSYSTFIPGVRFGYTTSIHDVWCWLHYLYTRCWMLATLPLIRCWTLAILPLHWNHMLDVGYTSPILGVGCWQYSTCIRWRLYIHTRCWILATLPLYQVLDIGYPTSILGVGCWLHYIYTRCWMLATLPPYQVLDIGYPTSIIKWHQYQMLCVGNTLYILESIHPYQVLDIGDTRWSQLLDVGYTTPIPGVGCWRYYTCTYTRCWRQYIYNRWWMLTTLYAYTRCFYTYGIPDIYYRW